MILDRKEKQPAEVKDFTIDYGTWLAETAAWLSAPPETLVDVSAVVVCETDPDNVSLVVVNLVQSPQGVLVRLSGGTDGERYKVTVTVTTNTGQIDQSEFIVRVKEY